MNIKVNLIKGIVLLGAIVFLFGTHPYLQITRDFFRNLLGFLDWYGSIIFLILYAVRPFFFRAPILISLIVGVTFGFMIGTIYTVMGMITGAIISYFVEKRLAIQAAERGDGLENQI
jgi:uncharacterized membrane protein YdjX (TVP38/TMEM64 family)